MGRLLCMLTGFGLCLWLLDPKPETIIKLLTVLWVIYAAFYAFMWLCGKFVMSAVRKGIRDGTLKFKITSTEEKGEGSE